jgi:hypothetical protein
LRIKLELNKSSAFGFATSNDNFNVSEAAIFNDFINNLELIEIPLLDRQFTWSNLQDPLSSPVSIEFWLIRIGARPFLTPL